MTDHAHTGPQPSDAQAFWDKKYAQDRVWSGSPSPHLVARAKDLPPGRALDLGAGEGADAIWLAQRGWEVVALDISPVALSTAQEHAPQMTDRGEHITWESGDLYGGWQPTGHYQLISAQYLHVPRDQMAAIYPVLEAAVAPGGYLLIANHHPNDLLTGVPRPPDPNVYSTPEEVVAELEASNWATLQAMTLVRDPVEFDGTMVDLSDTVIWGQKSNSRA